MIKFSNDEQGKNDSHEAIASFKGNYFYGFGKTKQEAALDLVIKANKQLYDFHVWLKELQKHYSGMDV